MPVIGNAENFLEDRNVPGMVDFNPMMLLYGENSLEIFKTIKPDEKYSFE